MVARKSHLQGVEREIDVGTVLVAARRHVALYHLDRMLSHLAAVLARPRPVSICHLGHHFTAFLQRLEHHGDVKLLPQSVLNPDLDIVEVDEHCQFQSFFSHSSFFLLFWS